MYPFLLPKHTWWVGSDRAVLFQGQWWLPHLTFASAPYNRPPHPIHMLPYMFLSLNTWLQWKRHSWHKPQQFCQATVLIRLGHLGWQSACVIQTQCLLFLVAYRQVSTNGNRDVPLKRQWLTGCRTEGTAEVAPVSTCVTTVVWSTPHDLIMAGKGKGSNDRW